MRGAGYTAFDGAVPQQPEHGGVAAAYAHVTAPLRRLADRFATEVCLALHEGTGVPEWARQALPKLPDVMTVTDHLASAAEHGAVDLAEAVLLPGGSVTSSTPRYSTSTSRSRMRRVPASHRAVSSRWTHPRCGLAARVPASSSGSG